MQNGFIKCFTSLFKSYYMSYFLSAQTFSCGGKVLTTLNNLKFEYLPDSNTQKVLMIPNKKSVWCMIGQNIHD